MNWVDLVIILVILLITLEGFKKSLILETVDFFGFLIAFLFSLRIYHLASLEIEKFLSVPLTLANVLGFIVIWFLLEILLSIFFRILIIPLKIIKPFPGEGILSLVPAFLKGLVLVTIILVLVVTFPLQPGIKKDVQKSLLAKTILNKAYYIEAPLKNIFGGLAQDTLTFLTVHPKSDERVNLGFKTDQFTPSIILEDQMIDLVNQERVKLGLKKLTYDASLKKLARKHSADMFLNGYFSHFSPDGKNVADRADESNIKYLVIGENLALAPTLELAHQGLMNSEGHRANILSADYHKIGIGVLESDRYGLMITQVFSN